MRLDSLSNLVNMRLPCKNILCSAKKDILIGEGGAKSHK